MSYSLDCQKKGQVIQVTERLFQEFQRLRKSLAVLQEISLDLIMGNKSLDEHLQRVVNSMVEFMKVKKASIMLLEKPGYLTIRAHYGMPLELVKKTKVSIGSQIAGRVIKNKKAILVKDIAADMRFQRRPRQRYETNSFICAPIRISDRIMGVINLNDKENGASFDQYDLELVTIIANHTATVIENFNLLEKLKSTVSRLNKSNLRLRSTQLRLRAIIERIVDGIVVTDESGKVILLNKSANIFFPNLRKKYSLFTGMPSGKAGEWLKHHFKTFKNGGPDVGEIAIQFGKSQIMRFKVQVLKIHAPQNTDTFYLWSFTDVTFQRSLEEKKREFLALLSHELRTPITVIKTYLSAMTKGVMGTFSEDQVDALSTMLDAVNRLQTEVDNLMIMSKIDKEDFQLELTSFNIKKEIEKQKKFLESNADENKIRLLFNLEDDLPLVLGDPTLIRVAISNLIRNAIKFSPENSVVKVECRFTHRKQKPYIEFSVTDNGPGISPQELERIFSRFEQVEAHLTRRIGGVGLGLSIVQRIMELHGGTILVDSIPGKGSRFAFLLDVIMGK